MVEAANRVAGGSDTVGPHCCSRIASNAPSNKNRTFDGHKHVVTDVKMCL